MLDGKGLLIVPFVKNIDVIVDLGANVGAAAVLFSEWYPSARILSYEPCSIQFEALKKNTKERPNIEPTQCGLSDKNESVDIGLSRVSGLANSIVDPINETMC
jgi:FkbM family methyltransferase